MLAASLGWPASGPGSVAPTGRRATGLALDLLLVGLLGLPARLIPGATGLRPNLAETALFVVAVVVLQATTGRTPGMLAAGTRLVRVHGGRAAPGWLLLRTLLVLPLVLSFVTDADGRSLPDRAAGTVVVLT